MQGEGEGVQLDGLSSLHRTLSSEYGTTQFEHTSAQGKTHSHTHKAIELDSRETIGKSIIKDGRGSRQREVIILTLIA